MKSRLIVICLLQMLLFTYNVFAQGVDSLCATLSFIKCDLNRLERFENGSIRALEYFFSRLDTFRRNGHGRINILHIGASHVQAGYFPDCIRKQFYRSISQVYHAPGLVFPYAMAKTNNPFFYKTEYTGQWEAYRNVQRSMQEKIGLSGIVSKTRNNEARVSIIIKNNDSTQYNWKRVRVIADCGVNICQIGILWRDSIIPYQRCDNIRHEYVFEIPEYSDTVTLVFTQTDSSVSELYLRAILLEPAEDGLVYYGIGVNGASTMSYVNSVFFAHDVQLLKPDLIIFAIGVNDTHNPNFQPETFYRNYKELISIVRSVNPRCDILFITNNDTYKRVKRQYYPNRNNAVAREVIYQLAQEEGAAVWDLYSIMGGFESMKQWESHNLAKRDKIHFTPEGYRLLGTLFFQALWNAYMESHSLYQTIE